MAEDTTPENTSETEQELFTGSMVTHFHTMISRAEAQFNADMAQAREHRDNMHEAMVRRADLAVDHQWNINEQILALTKNAVFKEAIAAAVAVAVQNHSH